MNDEVLVTYTVEVNGKLLVVENVPARIDDETGEQLFSPATVERLRAIAHGGGTPMRTAEVPVYDFAA